MKLALDKKIELDLDDVTQTNHAAIMIHYFQCLSLLKAYKNVFAWSYKKMSGLDPKVVVHHL